MAYKTRPQAYDTEPLDLEKTWEEKSNNIYIFLLSLVPKLEQEYFRDFPQELNFNILIHDTTHLQEHIGEKLFGNDLLHRFAKYIITFLTILNNRKFLENCGRKAPNASFLVSNAPKLFAAGAPPQTQLRQLTALSSPQTP